MSMLICTLPDGQKLKLLCNDEKGASTSDGAFRVFVGLRADPFLLAWVLGGKMRPFQNLLEHGNVLCMVVDFDTQKVLQPEQGSLFGVIAETTPIPTSGGLVGHAVPRFDWVGRPEQLHAGQALVSVCEQRMYVSKIRDRAMCWLVTPWLPCASTPRRRWPAPGQVLRRR